MFDFEVPYTVFKHFSDMFDFCIYDLRSSHVHQEKLNRKRQLIVHVIMINA